MASEKPKTINKDKVLEKKQCPFISTIEGLI